MSLRLLLGTMVMVAGMVPSLAAASDATIFRIFLKDGTAVASYGEFSKVEDRVIFSMPVGGSPDNPRLHVVWIPAKSVDWQRTDHYAASARYQQYAQTRGEEDFLTLSNEVARVLNDIALSTDRAKATAIAADARRALADWPRTHYGYRQDDVREIVALIDEAIAGLRGGAGSGAFDLSLVATAPTVAVELEPMLPMPTLREQLDQVMHLAATADSPSERVALLQSALAMVNEAGSTLGVAESTAIRRSTERQLRDELTVDRRYAQMSQRLMTRANREAANARITGVERVMNRIEREDSRLGRKRPETVTALRASVGTTLESARRLRLLRDQWMIRRSIYRDYQRMVGTQLLQLVQTQPSLESIRRFDGPPPSTLVSLRTQLSGGAERLQRLAIPSDMRSTHDLFVGAWRFAENAVRGRYDAVSTGNVATAWEASSAAAGALMMLSRVQLEIRDLLEPPKLQ